MGIPEKTLERSRHLSSHIGSFSFSNNSNQMKRTALFYSFLTTIVRKDNNAVVFARYIDASSSSVAKQIAVKLYNIELTQERYRLTAHRIRPQRIGKAKGGS